MTMQRIEVQRRERGDGGRVVLEVKDFNLWYGPKQALKNICMTAAERKVTALIGPSGCGKSTLLRCVNRLNDLVEKVKIGGEMFLNGRPIYGSRVDILSLRKRIGMVFQKSNPFPMSIFENVVYGLRIQGIRNRATLAAAAEKALRGAALWDEVKDRLNETALGLSGGQQQRLCIARALANEPEIILFDEPTSALDPISTARIEDLIIELRKTLTILIVTHNMHQAARISDYTAFMYMGELIEFDETETIFTNPGQPMTEQYVTGRFG